MSQNRKKSAIDIATTTRMLIGSFGGSDIGVQLTGSGTTFGDSDWKLVESNDRVTWVDITGSAAAFANIGNETLSFSANDVHNMQFLALEKVAIGTETTGELAVDATVK